MKRLVALLVALALLLTCTAAFAATNTDSLDDVVPFKFAHHKNGIGCGTCPVYSAPSTDAYRAANGKACCDTNDYVDEGGFNSAGWLLVRYTTNGGGTRVGWIPPKYVKSFSSSMYPHFSRVAQTADGAIDVTENNLDPTDPAGVFATLQDGDTYYVIARYNYYGDDLWYIEFELDGQEAYGFIPVEQDPS